MDESQFKTRAEATLEIIFDKVEDELGEAMEADMDGGVLSIDIVASTAIKRGQYVLNLQTPNREIWMSSPISGASHFRVSGANADDNWTCTRGGDPLLAQLAVEFSKISGTVVRF